MTQPPEQPPTDPQPWQAPTAPQPAAPWQPQPVQPPQQQWQPEPAYAYAGPPGGVPPTDPAKRKRTLIIVAAVVLVVVGVIAASVIYTIQANRRAEEQAAHEAAERVASVSAAVQGMFDAIVAGDAATALSHVDAADADISMITDEMLAASAEIAPIADIVVTAPDEVGEYSRSASVAVTYQLGDVAVEQEYQVRDSDQDGTWLIDGAIVEASLYELPEGLEVTLNGVALTSPEITLLPGAYRLGTSATYYTLVGETDFQITQPYFASVPSLEFALDDDGVAAFRDAVTSAVDECVSSSDLETGCGLAVPAELSDGTELEDGTLERTLTDDAQATLESLEPTISYSDPTIASGGYIGAVDVEAECTKGDQSGTCTILFAPSLSSPSVAMTDPDLPVTWD